ncbi:MAG: hypothetical protein ACP5G5_06730 [Thermoplasmata archaeon]|nr:MAG: hypothetical protein C0180_03435 [Aciduliprofundum sp.]
MGMIEIFTPGILNFLKEKEGFPWESIIVEAQHLGYSTYLIFGNVVPLDLRMLYTILKRMGNDIKILIRRGFTYHQLLKIVMDLERYHDLVIFFHDPVAFEDLRADERYAILGTILISLSRYAGTLNSICIYSSREDISIPIDVRRVSVEFLRNGWLVRANGLKRYMYNDPHQTSLDYYMEV